MDFRGRSSNQAAPRAAAAAPTPVASTDSSPFDSNNTSKLGKQPAGKLFRIGSLVLLYSVTGLVIALTFLLVFGGNSQLRSVKKDQYQAVFLNNGQVYFGNIKGLNQDTVDLRNIYYLQTSSTTATTSTAASSNVSLVKLGCELHAPYDQMLINKDQVIFWENIQDSSQVVKAIADYKKQNTTTACSSASQSSTNQAPSTTSTPTPSTTKP